MKTERDPRTEKEIKFKDMGNRLIKILNYLGDHISATRQDILTALGLEELKG